MPPASDQSEEHISTMGANTNWGEDLRRYVFDAGQNAMQLFEIYFLTATPVNRYEASRHQVPKLDEPVFRITRDKGLQSKAQAVYNPVLNTYRDQSKQTQFVEQRQKEQVSAINQAFDRSLQHQSNFDIISGRSKLEGLDKGLSVPHTTRTTERLGLGQGKGTLNTLYSHHLLSNEPIHLHHAVPPSSRPMFSDEVKKKRFFGGAVGNREFDILSNRYRERNEERTVKDEDVRQKEAGMKWQQVEGDRFNVVTCRFNNEEKQAAWEQSLEDSEAIVEKANNKYIPPSYRNREMAAYDIVSGDVVLPELNAKYQQQSLSHNRKGRALYENYYHEKDNAAYATERERSRALLQQYAELKDADAQEEGRRQWEKDPNPPKGSSSSSSTARGRVGVNGVWKKLTANENDDDEKVRQSRRDQDGDWEGDLRPPVAPLQNLDALRLRVAAKFGGKHQLVKALRRAPGHSETEKLEALLRGVQAGDMGGVPPLMLDGIKDAHATAPPSERYRQLVHHLTEDDGAAFMDNVLGSERHALQQQGIRASNPFEARVNDINVGRWAEQQHHQPSHCPRPPPQSQLNPSASPFSRQKLTLSRVGSSASQQSHATTHTHTTTTVSKKTSSGRSSRRSVRTGASTPRSVV